MTDTVEAFQAHATAKEVSLSADIGSAPAQATFDAARIVQVLTHLLREAIHRTAAPGTVRVHSELFDDVIRVTVTDTGVEVPGDMERIFDRFHAIDAHPARAGDRRLFVCKCIIQRHGGRIWAERNAGGGTTFGLTLPC